MAPALVVPSLALEIELASFSSRPAFQQSLMLEIELEAIVVERPFTGTVALVDLVVDVDGGHHRIAHRTPSAFVGKRRENVHIDGRATMVDQRQAADEFAAIERLPQIDVGEHLRQQPDHVSGVAEAVKPNLLLFLGGKRST